MPSKGISGGAVGLMAAGAVLVWSGLNNSGVLDTLRSLAKGQAPTPNRKPAFQPISGGGNAGAYDMSGIAATGQRATIIAEARRWLGTKYVYGGCHGCTPCHPGQGVDCSSFVTWVMKAVGLYKGKCSMVAGSNMLAWGRRRSAFETPEPGDVVLWIGKHCGIVTDPQKHLMIAAPHTGDVVKEYSYDFSLGVQKVFLVPPGLAG